MLTPREICHPKGGPSSAGKWLSAEGEGQAGHVSSRASGQRQVVEGLRPYVGRLRTSNFALSVEGQETDGRGRRGRSWTGPGLGTPLWLCLSMAHGTDQRSAEQGLLAAVLWCGPGSALPRQTQLRRVKVGQTEAVTRGPSLTLAPLAPPPPPAPPARSCPTNGSFQASGSLFLPELSSHLRKPVPAWAHWPLKPLTCLLLWSP